MFRLPWAFFHQLIGETVSKRRDCFRAVESIRSYFDSDRGTLPSIGIMIETEHRLRTSPSRPQRHILSEEVEERRNNHTSQHHSSQLLLLPHRLPFPPAPEQHVKIKRSIPAVTMHLIAAAHMSLCPSARKMQHVQEKTEKVIARCTCQSHKTHCTHAL